PMRLPTRALALSVCLTLAAAAARAGEKKPLTVETGRKVTIEYTVTLDDGTEAARTGDEPMGFEQGAPEIPPALEKALAGMKVSERRKIPLAPDQAYGAMDPDLLVEVPVDQIPEEARVVGATLAAQDSEGNEHPAVVHEVRPDKIVVDLNHPLA